MVGLSFDFPKLVMVASMSGHHVAADHARVYAAIENLDRMGREERRPIALVFVVAPGTSAPDAHWRRKFAQQRRTFGSPRVLLSMVTDSAIMRGVLTAMSWISPEPARITSVTHATFEESAAWVEREQGASTTLLRALLDRANASTRKPAEVLSV